MLKFKNFGIVTLYSGEDQFNESRKSILNQSLRPKDYKLIENKDNHEAHGICYKYIMKNPENCDYFLKLDADMIVNSREFLRSLNQTLIEMKDIDHLTIPVFDSLSQTYIPSLHCYSKRATWEHIESRLFVDPNPIVPGNRANIRPSTNLLINHMPKPTIWQSFFYGYHRGLKIFQKDHADQNEKIKQIQIKLFQKINKLYRQHQDIPRKAAIVGLALSKNNDETNIKSKRKKLQPEHKIRRSVETFPQSTISYICSAIENGKFFE